MARELHKGDLTVDRLESQLKFLIEIDKMKNVQRQTLLADGSRRETDAEHSWHMAVMAMLLIEYAEDKDKIDLNRVVRMCLVHDLVEVYAGDTFCYDEAAKLDKPQREREAADRLFSLLPADQGTELRALWEEFDEAQTPDAAYAAAIDRIQPLINNHLTNGHTWRGGRVKAHQVYARMEKIRNSSPRLYEYACGIIEENIKKGNLSVE